MTEIFLVTNLNVDHFPNYNEIKAKMRKSDT